MSASDGGQRPFPIPVAMVGPGSQGEEGPDYLPMPRDMHTFSLPRLPEDVSPQILSGTASLLTSFLQRMRSALSSGTKTTLLDLIPLDAQTRRMTGELLGYGEVSAFTVGEPQWRVQETAFAGLWRVLHIDADENVVADWLEASAIPATLEETMRLHTATSLPPPDYADGTMNAPALVEEIRQQAVQPANNAHVINLTLLPTTEVDLRTLYDWLGHREVSILSRGYGNCRITSTRLTNVWWVQYFNSMDTLILNTIEITPMPVAALAAEDDIRNSCDRLEEYLAMIVRP